MPTSERWVQHLVLRAGLGSPFGNPDGRFHWERRRDCHDRTCNSQEVEGSCTPSWRRIYFWSFTEEHLSWIHPVKRPPLCMFCSPAYPVSTTVPMLRNIFVVVSYSHTQSLEIQLWDSHSIANFHFFVFFLISRTVFKLYTSLLDQGKEP